MITGKVDLLQNPHTHFFLAGAAAFLAGALPPPEIFLASCLNLKLLFFLLIMTLNLSKSFKLALLALKAIFLATPVAAHFSANLKASAAFLAKGKSKCLLYGAGSGALEDLNLEVGEAESLEGVEDTGESGSRSINENSATVNDFNNHANLAKVFSEVHVGNATRLDEVLEHLKKYRLKHRWLPTISSNVTLY